MASKISINLDTSKENYILTKCKQDDDLTLEAMIYENGLALDLTNKEIFIKALKADGTYINQSTGITKANNKMLADLIRDFSRVPGTTKIEILLVEGGKQNTTFSFFLEVVGSVVKGAVESTNTVSILEELDNKVLEAGQVKEETEQLIATGGAATTGDIAKINSSLEQKANKDEVANGLVAKGSLLYANLPDEGNNIGDYYYCKDGNGIDGAGNYVWNGIMWYFGGTGDEGYNIVSEKLNDIRDIVGGLNYNNIIDDKTITDISNWNKTGNIVSVSNSLSNGIRIDNSGGSATQSVSCLIPISSLKSGEYYLSLKRFANKGNILTKVSVLVGLISSSTGLFGGYANIISDSSNTNEAFSERTFTLNKESLLLQYPKATHISISSSVPAGYDLTHYEFFLSLNNITNKDYEIKGFMMDILNKAVENGLYKKSMYYDGDSIAFGAGNNGIGFGDIIAQRNNMILNKYAVSGATLAVYQPESRHNICTSVVNNFKNEDIALIEGGFNDFGNGLAFGSLSSNVRVPLSDNPDNTTIVGAMEQIFQYIQKNSPKTKIYFVIVHKANDSYTKPLSSSGKTFTELHDLICSVCGRYAVEVIDIFKNSGFNTYYAEHKAFTKDNDGIHPNGEGYETFYVPYCEKQMR